MYWHVQGRVCLVLYAFQLAWWHLGLTVLIARTIGLQHFGPDSWVAHHQLTYQKADNSSWSRAMGRCTYLGYQSHKSHDWVFSGLAFFLFIVELSTDVCLATQRTCGTLCCCSPFCKAFFVHALPTALRSGYLHSKRNIHWHCLLQSLLHHHNYHQHQLKPVTSTSKSQLLDNTNYNLSYSITTSR